MKDENPGIISYDFQFDAEAVAMLTSLPMKIQKEIAFDALFIAVQPFLRAASAYAPVKKGWLKRSLAVRLKRYQAGKFLYAVAGPTNLKGSQSENPAKYGLLVELGHRIARNRGGRSTKIRPWTKAGRVPPHPFLRPAWEATKEQVFKTLGDEIGRRIAAEVVARRKATHNPRTGAYDYD